MTFRSIALTLLTGLALFSGSSQALVFCAKSDHVAAPAPAATGNSATADAPQVARLLAGMANPGEPVGPAFAQYAAAAEEGWQAYLKTFFQPLSSWAAKEVRTEPGRTVFYPFSGPDLPTLVALFPTASRFVMISDQYATRYFDPFVLKEAEQARVLRELGESWARFGRLGFFLTQELNKGGGRQYYLSPSMIMMSFAVRMGYEVRAVRPVCVDPADLAVHPMDARDARWGSVRLELRKNGRDLVVDYLQQDISNGGLSKRREARALIESLAQGPVLLKAASHLPQNPAFSILSKAILTHSPLVVQDETGLEYEALAKPFDLRLYGDYVKAHYRFKEFVNPSLVRAYKERRQDVRPLDFRFGYEKDIGSTIQVGTRR